MDLIALLSIFSFPFSIVAIILAVIFFKITYKQSNQSYEKVTDLTSSVGTIKKIIVGKEANITFSSVKCEVLISKSNNKYTISYNYSHVVKNNNFNTKYDQYKFNMKANTPFDVENIRVKIGDYLIPIQKYNLNETMQSINNLNSSSIQTKYDVDIIIPLCLLPKATQMFSISSTIENILDYPKNVGYFVLYPINRFEIILILDRSISWSELRYEGIQIHDPSSQRMFNLENDLSEYETPHLSEDKRTIVWNIESPSIGYFDVLDYYIEDCPRIKSKKP